jgi:hypothetical protein
MLQMDPNEIGNMFSNFTDSDSSIFEDKFFPSIHIFFCFACRWTSGVFGVFNRGHTSFELGKSLQDSADTNLSMPSIRNLF